MLKLLKYHILTNWFHINYELKYNCTVWKNGEFGLIEKHFVKSSYITYNSSQWKSWFHGIFVKHQWKQNFVISTPHYFFPSNQLSGNLFRKCVAFTKFLTINKNVTKKVGKSLCWFSRQINVFTKVVIKQLISRKFLNMITFHSTFRFPISTTLSVQLCGVMVV